MKTLVIHMKDSTTDFLKHIYKDKDYIIINDHIPSDKLNKIIEEHDRIIMLGHGSPFGLFGRGNGYIISSDNVEYLRDKELIGIWCHASEFAHVHQLNGFFSGMFISEVQEADCYRIRTTHNDVRQSNLNFAYLMNHVIEEPLNRIYNYITKRYISSGFNRCYDDVVTFNTTRLEYYDDNYWDGYHEVYNDDIVF